MQFIHLAEGAYPKESCTYLIDFFETNINLAEPGRAGNKRLNNLEICLDIDFRNPNSNIFGLENTLENILFQYKQKFPLIDSNIGRWHVSPTCQLTKYEPNNYYESLSEGYDTKVDALVDSMGVSDKLVSQRHERRDLDAL